jgi:tetratricopeptide (TPR) repeat protein
VQLALRDGIVALGTDALWVDVDHFEAQAERARTSRTVEAYIEALELYGGELLPEDRFEDWVQARRDQLRETQLALLVELAALQAEQGERGAAVATLQRAIVEDPLHEAAHRELMRLFAQDGRSQQALAQYQQLRDVLRRELAADPDPQTRELYREILAGQHDEGGTDAQPSLLPRQLTGFVGRERELAELERLLAGARLLTLTGPGGCGKTRLALELAARGALDARLVELAPIRDPALIAGETATAIGLQLRAEDDPVAALVAKIGDASLLLVLDNCEHLIDACAVLADALLRSCPNVRVLATSRERLRIPGETAWRVPSLSLPRRDAPFILNILASTFTADGYDETVDWAQATHAALAPALTGAAYANFLSDEGEERIRAANAPDTYRRLVALKDEYDPSNVFRLNQNVKPSGA